MNTYHGPRLHAAGSGRRKWQNPEAILTDIGLKPGLIFIDVGCGGGFFTLPAARMVGKSGEVYGLDTDAQLISELRELADREGLQNLRLTVGRAEEVVVCEACADLAFFGTVLHDFDNPTRVLANARTMLKSTGRLINLDWKKQPMELGPPVYKRLSEQEAIHLIEAADLNVETIRDSGPYLYLIVAKPALRR